MTKKTIVLADNSYTIRRIVELSLSEEDIELHSFENGQMLKEKLMEIKPAVVLIDINLPEFNGYEVCRYIVATPELSQTKVFLMKGGFDPIDENQLKDLKYVDIITKPFDSNTLITSIKKVLEEFDSASAGAESEDISAAAPADMPEIDSIEEPDDEINFADIKDEIEMEHVPKEEIQPSEEITQGSIGETPDTLAPETSEEISNPFLDESPQPPQEAAEVSPKTETPTYKSTEAEWKEYDTDSFKQFSNIELPETQQQESQESEFEGMASANQMPEDSEQGEAVSAPIQEEGEDELAYEDLVSEASKISDSQYEASEEKTLEVETVQSKLDQEEESPLDGELAFEDNLSQPSVKEEDYLAQPVPEEQKPVEPADESSVEVETFPVMKVSAEKFPGDEEIEADEIEKKMDQLEEISGRVKKKAGRIEKKPPVVAAEISQDDKDKILHSVEDKLAMAIKEVLWEIMPLLAEKIIKEEIEQLKVKIDQESTL